MICAYNLPENPSAHINQAFIVHLRYVPNEDKRTQRFKIWKVSKGPLHDVFARGASDARLEDMVHDDQRMLEEAQRLVGEDFGGMGHICYIVERRDERGEVIKIHPIGFSNAIARQAPHRTWALGLIQTAGNLSREEVREILTNNNLRV